MVTAKLKYLSTYLIGLIATLIFVVPIVFQSLTLPTVSDQSLTEGAIINAVSTGAMDGVYDLLKSWYTYPKVLEGGMALHYPYHLYSVGVLGYLFFQNWTFIVYPTIMAGLVVFFTKKLGDELIRAITTKDKVDFQTSLLVWLSSLAILSSGWLNGFRFEMLFTTLMVTGLFFILRFYRTRGYSEAVLGTMALSFAAVVRQNYTMFAGAVLAVTTVQVILMSPRKNLVRVIPTVIGLPLVIIGTYYAFLIETTGTISYFSESGYPYLDTQVFSPDYLEFEGLNQELNEDVNRGRIFDKMYAGFQNQYPSLASLYHGPWSIGEMYRNINSNLYMSIVAFAPLVALGAIVWFAKRSPVWYLYAAMLVPYMGTWALYTSNPRYLHMQYFLGVFALVIPTTLIVSKLRVTYRVITLGFAVIFLVQGVFLNLSGDYRTVTATYWGVPEGEYKTAIEPLNEWIATNTAEDSRIFTVLQREVSLATGRETIWDARLWFVRDIGDTLNYWDNLHQADYIIIKTSDIKKQDAYSGPGDIPEGSTLLSLVRSTPVFEKVYEVQDFTLYKFKPNDLEI